VPVVPVALIGLNEIRAEKMRWFRSGRVIVRVGRAIHFEEGTKPAEITARLEERLLQLLKNN
jgi:long-chain acyl-CoA synthetase